MRRALVIAALLGCRASVVPETPRSNESAPPSCAAPWIHAETSEGPIARIPAVDVAVLAEGPIARTRLTITFAQHDDLANEVLASLHLPESAVISDFETQEHGRWQSSSTIERYFDTVLDEAFLPPRLRQLDPERRVDIHVRPVEGDATKRVRITWLQPLVDDARTLRIPLCGGPTIGALSVTVRNGSEGPSRRQAWSEIRRTADLQVPLEPGRASAIRSGNWLAATIEPAAQRVPISHITLLVDTSASRARTFGLELNALAKILADLERRDPKAALTVLAFDQRTRLVYDGPVEGYRAAVSDLRVHGALGGTDLVGALTRLQLDPAPTRVIAFTDASATLGHTDVEARDASIDRFGSSGIERVDVLVPRGVDAAALEPFASHAQRPGAVLPVDLDPSRIVDALSRRVPTVPAAIRGAVFMPRSSASSERYALLLARLGSDASWPRELPPPVVVPPELGLVAPLGHAARLEQMERALAHRVVDSRRYWQLVESTTVFAREHGLVSRWTARHTSDSLLVVRSPDFVEPPRRGPTTPLYVESQLQRLLDTRDRAWLRALESWAHGHEAGPRPDAARLATPDVRDAEAALRQHVRAGLVRAPVSGELAKIEALLDDGALDEARAIAEAWFARDPHAPLAALAGGRVAMADGKHARAARWFGSTYESPEIGAPGWGAGVFFLDFAHADPREAELFVESRRLDPPPRLHVLKGIAALARGEGIVAAESFAAAIQHTIDASPESGVRGGRAPPAYERLLAIAAATNDARRAPRRLGVAPSRAPERVIVLAASSLGPGEIALLLEGDDDVLLSSHLHALERPTALAAMFLHHGKGAAARGGRALVHASSASTKHPLVGALWVVTHDGRGHVAVAHHPFVFTNRDATIALSLSPSRPGG